MVVVTMRGRWTIKRKEKEKKRTERGGEGGGGGEGTAREEISWSKGKFIYRAVYSDAESSAMPRDYLVVAGGLGWGVSMNWFADFPPSGAIYNSTLPRVRETPKGNGPNSNLRPLRSSPFTSFILAWAHFLLSVQAERSSMLRAGSKT
jgi:hypothetical protein